VVPAAAATPAAAGPAGTDGAAAAAKKAPDTYALTIPDVAKDILDPADLTRIEKVAREGNLSNEEAQSLVETQATIIVEELAALRKVTEADKDYGGDKLVETERLSKLVIDKVRPQGHARREAFNAMLRRSGYGNHIEVVSFLADLGKLMREDSPAMAASGAGGTSNVDIADKLYDKTPKQ
jgi:hypothetical protein